MNPAVGRLAVSCLARCSQAGLAGPGERKKMLVYAHPGLGIVWGFS